MTATLEVPDTLVAKAVSLELDITHPSHNDLVIALEHDGVESVVWNGPLESNDDLPGIIAAPDFAGKSGTGAWTLKVMDQVVGGQGTLNGWRLVVEPQ